MRYLGQLDPAILAQMKAQAPNLSDDEARQLYEVSEETDFHKKKTIVHVVGGAAAGIAAGGLLGMLLWKKR